MKNLIAIAVLFLAASFCFNSDTFAQDLPLFEVKVLQHESTDPDCECIGLILEGWKSFLFCVHRH